MSYRPAHFRARRADSLVSCLKGGNLGPGVIDFVVRQVTNTGQEMRGCDYVYFGKGQP